MKFKTLNSTYEVDTQTSRIRRLAGVNQPTDMTGTDGVWRSYFDIPFPITIGHCAFVKWSADDEMYLRTSPVTAIEPDEPGAEPCSQQQQSPAMTA